MREFYKGLFNGLLLTAAIYGGAYAIWRWVS